MNISFFLYSSTMTTSWWFVDEMCFSVTHVGFTVANRTFYHLVFLQDDNIVHWKTHADVDHKSDEYQVSGLSCFAQMIRLLQFKILMHFAGFIFFLSLFSHFRSRERVPKDLIGSFSGEQVDWLFFFAIAHPIKKWRWWGVLRQKETKNALKT